MVEIRFVPVTYQHKKDRRAAELQNAGNRSHAARVSLKKTKAKRDRQGRFVERANKCDVARTKLSPKTMAFMKNEHESHHDWPWAFGGNRDPFASQAASELPSCVLAARNMCTAHPLCPGRYRSLLICQVIQRHLISAFSNDRQAEVKVNYEAVLRLTVQNRKFCEQFHSPA